MKRLHRSASSEQRLQRVAAYASADVVLDSSSDAPEIGAHLVTQRRGYAHHGIYAGNGLVIHYAGFAKSAHRGPVEEVPLAQFADGHAVAIRPHPFPRYTGAETLLRARSRLGENRYGLLTNNCEHFCAWCLVGESRSEQVHVCFTHPRTGLHAMLCLASAFIGKRMKTRFNAVNAV